jgi:hypothetical protein
MHDFDNNNQLDHEELRAAYQSTADQIDLGEQGFEMLLAQVRPALLHLVPLHHTHVPHLHIDTSASPTLTLTLTRGAGAHERGHKPRWQGLSAGVSRQCW